MLNTLRAYRFLLLSLALPHTLSSQSVLPDWCSINVAPRTLPLPAGIDPFRDSWPDSIAGIIQREGNAGIRQGDAAWVVAAGLFHDDSVRANWAMALLLVDAGQSLNLGVADKIRLSQIYYQLSGSAEAILTLAYNIRVVRERPLFLESIKGPLTGSDRAVVISWACEAAVLVKPLSVIEPGSVLLNQTLADNARVFNHAVELLGPEEQMRALALARLADPTGLYLMPRARFPQ